ncbi:MAG: alpha/beta hydrolase [Limnochordia bacterium]
MTERTFFFEADDQVEIFVRQWAKVDNPRAVLQIAHGMAEHSARYARFARACNEQGIIVVANDHRGHGHTGERAGVLGYFSPDNGFDRVVDDLHLLNQWLGAQYPDLPIFLLGHSMGSFLARRYIQKYASTIRGVILMGSGGDPGFAVKIAKFIALQQMKKDPTKPSPLLHKLTLGGYNRSVKNPRTSFDWLTRDHAEVDKYIADPFCGFMCSSGFYYDLFTGLELIHAPDEIKGVPPDLPILVVSGEADPVGANGKGIRQFVKLYEECGLKRIKTILYQEARHELLNETNREEAIRDIFAWLEEQLA